MQSITPIRAVEVGEIAPDAQIRLADGQQIDMASYWLGSPNGAVIVLLRNFGCLFCRDQARRLRAAMGEINARKINLVAIGIGSPRDADEFSAWLKLPYRVLGQPDTSVHAAWGLGRSSAGNTLDPDLVKAGIRALRSGSMQGKPTGDSRQLPGTFIVDSSGIVRWARPGRHPGDNPTIEELLAAIDTVRSGQAE